MRSRRLRCASQCWASFCCAPSCCASSTAEEGLARNGVYGIVSRSSPAAAIQRLIWSSCLLPELLEMFDQEDVASARIRLSVQEPATVRRYRQAAVSPQRLFWQPPQSRPLRRSQVYRDQFSGGAMLTIDREDLVSVQRPV